MKKRIKDREVDVPDDEEGQDYDETDNDPEEQKRRERVLRDREIFRGKGKN